MYIKNAYILFHFGTKLLLFFFFLGEILEKVGFVSCFKSQKKKEVFIIFFADVSIKFS